MDGRSGSGEAKDGTTRFYRVATAYAIHHSQRVTLAMRFVLPGDQAVEVVRELRQTLLLRGTSEFADVPAYEQFVAETVRRLNARCARAWEAERT